MGFVCGVLLLHLREDDAFFLLASVLSRLSLEGLYRPGLPLLDKYFFQFQKLLDAHMPT